MLKTNKKQAAYFSLIVLMSLVFFVIGCATHAIKPEKLNSMNRVSAVSLLGNDLRVVYASETVLTSKWLESDVRDWHIDEFVRQVIAENISADGRHTFVDVSTHRDAMMKIYGSTEASPRHPRDYDLNVVKDEIQNVRSKYGIDILLFILEAGADSPTAGGMTLTSYGVHQDCSLGLKHTCTYTNVRMVCVDTSSLQELSSISLGKFDTIDSKYWSLDFEKLTPNKKQFVQESIKKQLRSELSAGLQKGKLIR